MVGKTFQNRYWINSIGCLAALLFWCASCQNRSSIQAYAKENSKHIDTLKQIISDYSTGSLFLVVKIRNNQTGDVSNIIVQNHVLAKYIKGNSDETIYEKKVEQAITEKMALDVAPLIYTELVSAVVPSIDTSVSNAFDKGDVYFINHFFQKNARGIFVKCFADNKIEKQVVFLLVEKLKRFVRTDDETGCVIL